MKRPQSYYDPVANNPKPYRLLKDYTISTGIIGHTVYAPLYTLKLDGTLVIQMGFRWDGATGAIDGHSVLPASLVHDVLCELTNNGRIPYKYRRHADRLFRRQCITFATSPFGRAWAWPRWAMVRIYSEKNRAIRKWLS